MAGVAPRSRAGTIKSLSSRQNPAVRLYRTLARERALEDDGRRLLIEGIHLLTEARAAGLTIESAAFSHDLLAKSDLQSLARTLAAEGTEVLEVSDKVLAAMSPARTPSGVVAIAACAPRDVKAVLEPAPQLVVLAVDVQDPGNIGAMIRTCEAAGGTGVVACGTSADPFGWKALRGSMGSAFRLPVVRANLETAVLACRAAGLHTFGTVPYGGRTPFDLDLRQPSAFVLGGEGQGLPNHALSAADTLVSIPMEPPVESLNVAVAAALLLYEARRQRSVPGWCTKDPALSPEPFS